MSVAGGQRPPRCAASRSTALVKCADAARAAALALVARNKALKIGPPDAAKALGLTLMRAQTALLRNTLDLYDRDPAPLPDTLETLA